VILLFVLLISFRQPLYAAEDTQPASDDAPLTLTLLQVLERARLSNRSLQQRGLLVANSRYSLQSAESEFDWKMRPVANLGLSKSNNSTAQATGVSGEISKKSSLGIKAAFSPSIAYLNEEGVSSGVGVSLSVPLFRGFGKEYTLDSVYAADFSLQSSIRNVHLAEVDKIMETLTLAYEVLRQQKLTTLYRAQAERLGRHVRTIQLKETAGLGSQIDTYRAQIRQKDVENQLNIAIQSYQTALDRLKVLLALPVEKDLQLVIPLDIEPTQIGEDEAEEIALANRLELEQVAADLLEAKRKSRVAERRILPDLNFVATYRKNTFLEGIDASQSYYGDYWSVGLTSDTDMARSSEKATYAQSLLEIRRLQLSQATRRDTIRAEVRTRLNALHKEEKSIHLRQEQGLQATGKRRLAEIKFSHGMGDNFDFIEADTELQQARANLLSAKINYIVGQYRLRAALGTLIAIRE
jgi:outer membrane protein TolC